MKINQWTRALIATGVVGIGAAAQAEEAPASQVLTAVSGTQLSGYVSTSARWDLSSKANPGFNYAGGKNSDGFSLDVVDITIEKPLDEGEWSAGYVAEVWMGPDSAGFGNQVGVAAAANGGVSIRQAYVALNAPVGNGVVLKMGVWDTIVGYEVNDNPENPNFSRSFGYGLEPFAHTGLLASYQLCESVSAVAGIANSQNTGGINAGAVAGTSGSLQTYMAGVSFTAPESFGPLGGASINAAVIDGRTTTAAAGGPDTTHIYVGATIPTPVEHLNVGLAFDHVNVDGGADSDALAAYVSYGVSDKLTLHTRVDYVDDNAGTFAAASTRAGASAVAGAGAAELLGLTVTADYALWQDVLTRAEFRWDRDLSNGGHLPGNAGGATGNSHASVSLNVVYQF